MNAAMPTATHADCSPARFFGSALASSRRTMNT